MVSDTMRKLRTHGKAFFTTGQVPFAFPVFVVWQGPPNKRKGRMVVDLRPLNTMTLDDAYPMHRQEDITNMVAGASYVTVMDAMSFYYQWLLSPESR